MIIGAATAAAVTPVRWMNVRREMLSLVSFGLVISRLAKVVGRISMQQGMACQLLFLFNYGTRIF
jgi:hypothetical protein